MAKYRMLRERLAATGDFDFEPAPLASRDTIALAHDPAYVDQFLGGMLSPQVMRRIGFPWSPGLVARTCASVGGTLAAARRALEAGWGGTLAGGTHHAFYSEGSGFCVFNDLVVAIRNLRAERGLGRVAVIDLDVHQGDGTAAMLAGDPLCYTLSVHGRHNFPFHKQQSTVDVELEDRCDDQTYLRRLRDVLPALFAFGPELVFYQSGVDALAVDTLGRLSLTRAGLAARDELVLSSVARARVPLVLTLGGGYANPIEETVAAHAQTFGTAAKILGLPH